jgi:hypothetical protein
MRNEIVSPRFEEQSYQGKDVVHRGIRIPLQRPVKLTELSRNAQRIIKDQSIEISFREVLDGDLLALKMMWFDQEDVTYPQSMDGHIGFVAIKDRAIVGGVLWQKQGKNLFLHQLIADHNGRLLQAPTLLIWHSMRMFGMKEWHSLDIGVSYNPKRYQFFKNFEVETYPIILRKPFYVPVIRLSPFRSIEALAPEDMSAQAGDNTTFIPRASYGIYALLKHLDLKPDDQVAIFKTFGSSFISGCVTQQIEKVCQWRLRQITGQTKAILIIHEFGIECKDVPVNAFDYPVIEDCAWRNDKVFDKSNYAVFSLQKMFNINFGGLIDGIKLSDEFLWSVGCLDTVKREAYARALVTLEKGNQVRIDNWKLYHSLVIADGMTPDDCLDYEKEIVNGWMPTVYLQKFETGEIANAIVARLEEFGIQAGRYWNETVVYLPIHQNMTEAEVEYMFAVVKGYYNSCHAYEKI